MLSTPRPAVAAALVLLLSFAFASADAFAQAVPKPTPNLDPQQTLEQAVERAQPPRDEPAVPQARCGVPAPPPVWDGRGDQPVWDMSHADLDAFIKQLRRDEPDFRNRIRIIAQRTLRQPFSIYTLGEAPFEVHDDEPLANFQQSDALTWIEQTVALALADDWPTSFAWLQRIRYEDGRIGIATRNHYTEAQWNPGNDWLYRDVSAELLGAETYELHIKLADFLQRRFEVQTDRPDLFVTTAFLPWSAFEQALPTLRTGDVIQYVITENDAHWVNTLALIEVDDDGKVWKYQPAANAGLRRAELAPEVRNYAREAELIVRAKRHAEQNGFEFEDFGRMVGVKVLQLRDDPAARLRAIDGPHAPVVTFAPYAPLPGHGRGVANAAP